MNKLIKAKNTVKRAVKTVGATASLAVGQAYAAVPAEVTTAISDGLADGKDIAYGLLGFAIGVGVIMFIKRKASS